jgi:hypothetical protein
MMPAPVTYIVTEALRPDLAAQGGFAPSDWVIYAPVVTGIVAIVVSVGIAVWQWRERKAARLLEELKEVQPLLVELGVIASRAREPDPLDRDTISPAELDRIQWQLADFSDRCVPALGEALRTVGAATAKLRRIVMTNADVRHAYEALTSTPAGDLPPAQVASAIAARAVEQYRVAVELHEAIGAAWIVIRAQRGGKP